MADSRPPSSPDISQSETEKTIQQEEQQQQVAQPSPSRDFADWKWKGTIAVIYITSCINGYDVSNTANLQPRLYEAFGDIELLPWIGLSYSLSFFAVLSFARKIIYCFNMRWIYLTSLIVFIVGAVVSGAAPNMSAIIVGRVIMGLGGALVQQSNMSYMAVFATPAETPGLFASMSAMWAVGLVIGGPIGSAFADNHHATWRWAFYLNIPLVGLGFVIALLCVPLHSFGAKIPVWKRLAKIDPLGIALNMAAPVLFGLAMTFSGPIWAWGSGASIAIWVVFGVVLIFWGVQQYFCLFTTPDERAFPLHIMGRRDLIPLWLASACAGSSYAITLYYTPLYFAFAQGDDALDQTVKLLPFVLVFIVVVMMAGGMLPILGRYNLMYIVAGAATLAGGAAMAGTLSENVSESQVLGLEAVIGIGLGMHFQHGVGISNVINKNNRDRVDSVVIFNMAQMGGIAVILAVAGSIFQNVGYSLLQDAIGSEDGVQYTEDEIREALAGVSSVVWQSKDPEVLRRGVAAVSTVIAREFWIVAAGGALCMVCGLLMKWEKLDYGRKKKGDAKPSAP